jgi:hypothetical protein
LQEVVDSSEEPDVLMSYNANHVGVLESEAEKRAGLEGGEAVVEGDVFGLGGWPRRLGTMGGSSSDDGAAVIGLCFLARSYVTALFSAFFVFLGNASSSSPSVEASSQALLIRLTFEPKLAAGCFHTRSVLILLVKAGRRILRTFGKSGEAVHSK